MFSLVQIGLIVWAGLLSPTPAVSPQSPIPAVSAAEAAVSVRLVGGRTFIASIDHRTTTDRLWLRFGDDRIELLRPIKWDQVERVEIAGSEISGRELREFVMQLREEMLAQQ